MFWHKKNDLHKVIFFMIYVSDVYANASTAY